MNISIRLIIRGCDLYMSELAYSLHLGSDKNRKNVSRARAKSNASGTTSLSNNAIQNARQLSRVDKHNYRKYDDKGHLIEIVRGTTSLHSDVQKLYKNEFEEARLEYNSKQTRDDRKIDDYFKKISDNSKNDLACEIIIELGDKKYWDTKDDKFKHKMRTLCIASFNKEYGLNNILKTKQKGRNKDINVKDMENYIEMQEELSKYKERLEIANKKSLELDNNYNEVKDIVSNLKTTFTNKDKYVLNKDDKDKIDKYIQQVNSTNEEYKKMQKLSITLNDVEIELKENRKKVKILTENNDALNIKVKSFEKKVDRQEDEIDGLKEKNSKLQNTINFFETLFDRLVKFIKNKMFGKEKERENYWNFSKNLYTHKIFSDKTIESIKMTIFGIKKMIKIKTKEKMITKWKYKKIIKLTDNLNNLILKDL